MSWLNVFGRRKHKESPPDTPEEEQPPPDQDDFIFIEKRNPTPPNSNDIHTAEIYPSLPTKSLYSTTVSSGSVTMNQQGDCINYLSGVPFKLCKQLERKMNEDFDVEQLRVDEILSFIKRIENENYDYDFTTEESVIAEMSSGNNQYEDE